jgi:hypothetical protein
MGGLVMATAACGNRFTPPAAVVNGHRITQTDLRLQLDTVLTNPQTAEQIRGQGETGRKDLTRQVLLYLIELNLVQAYARSNQIAVAPQEIDQQLQQAIGQFGGQAQFLAELRRRRLTVTLVRLNIQRNLLFSKVEDRVAGVAGTTAGQQQQRDQAFRQWLLQRLAGASIQVNPRFGRLNQRQGVIAPITSTEG